MTKKMDTLEKKGSLVRVDKISIERTKEGLQNRADLLNKFVEVSETTLKTTFTDNEKIILKDKGLSFVNEWIKPKFKFPDADYIFNMQALGIDIAPITSYWNANAKHWNVLSVELEKGKFFIPNMDKLEAVTRHYHYAKNDHQEKAYKEATEICKSLNRLLEKKLIIEGMEDSISIGFKYVRFGSEANLKDFRLEKKFFPTEWLILKL